MDPRHNLPVTTDSISEVRYDFELDLRAIEPIDSIIEIERAGFKLERGMRKLKALEINKS